MPEPKRLNELAREAVEWIRKTDPSVGAEVYLSRSRDRAIELREGRLETAAESVEAGLGLRLCSGGRMAFAYSGGLEPEGLPALFERAKDQLPHLQADEHRVLPEPGAEAAPEDLDKTIVDASMFQEPLSGPLPRLTEMNARAMKKDSRIKKVLQIGYGENFTETAIASTTGVETLETETYANFGLGVMAGEADEVQVGGSSRMARHQKELDWAKAVDEGVVRTVSLLGAKKEPSRKCAVLFDPWAAGELLDLLAGALSADAVQRGKSLLKDRLGQRVASDLVTFIDDPLRPGGISSGRFDEEGVPTRTKTMVEKGVLRDYFFDTYTAHKGGRKSNGCAGRAGFKGMPGATASNFYLKPGKLSREQLIKDTDDGILVWEIMGMHTADPISGEMSVGVSGVAVVNGEITHGVRGAMLSAGILQLLERVDAVADDLTFYGSIAAPTFRVADLTVA
ncbi:MAG: TldD/PmbA family protein [Elusimicrobiota bacterium]